mmetsp:Transcript_14015/g.15488  ORF Transcript_14015/g.15488 Transcript_14015/m.15488 type:complete len:487 (+) Transcript_14015:122-1582(+)
MAYPYAPCPPSSPMDVSRGPYDELGPLDHPTNYTAPQTEFTLYSAALESHVPTDPPKQTQDYLPGPERNNMFPQVGFDQNLQPNISQNADNVTWNNEQAQRNDKMLSPHAAQKRKQPFYCEDVVPLDGPPHKRAHTYRVTAREVLQRLGSTAYLRLATPDLLDGVLATHKKELDTPIRLFLDGLHGRGDLVPWLLHNNVRFTVRANCIIKLWNGDQDMNINELLVSFDNLYFPNSSGKKAEKLKFTLHVIVPGQGIIETNICSQELPIIVLSNYSKQFADGIKELLRMDMFSRAVDRTVTFTELSKKIERILQRHGYAGLLQDYDYDFLRDHILGPKFSSINFNHIQNKHFSYLWEWFGLALNKLRVKNMTELKKAGYIFFLSRDNAELCLQKMKPSTFLVRLQTSRYKNGGMNWIISYKFTDGNVHHATAAEPLLDNIQKDEVLVEFLQRIQRQTCVSQYKPVVLRQFHVEVKQPNDHYDDRVRL